MTTENQTNDQQQAEKETSGEQKNQAGKPEKIENNATNESGDPGRTPGSAEGDEETIDEDIREKEAEGKL